MPTKLYQLYVKITGKWEWVCTIEADSHAEAFRSAMQCLDPRLYDKPIRLEQDPAEGQSEQPRGGGRLAVFSAR
jgi:hypothetical protein